MKGADRIDQMSEREIADIAASFQAAVVDVLVKKTKRAAGRIGARTVLVGGGVAANSALREAMERMCHKSRPPLSLLVAPKQYCTDNAAMVGSLAFFKYKAGQFAELTLEPSATG
jgi:N6-L-threonylcarbamoyladenine synthase